MENETTVMEQETQKQAGKLFTQEDVNRIIKERLNREREKYIRDANTRVQQKEAELIEREKKLTAREMWMQCREYVKKMGFPAEMLDALLEALNTSDFEGFKKKTDGICAAFGGNGDAKRAEKC